MQILIGHYSRTLSSSSLHLSSKKYVQLTPAMTPRPWSSERSLYVVCILVLGRPSDAFVSHFLYALPLDDESMNAFDSLTVPRLPLLPALSTHPTCGKSLQPPIMAGVKSAEFLELKLSVPYGYPYDPNHQHLQEDKHDFFILLCSHTSSGSSSSACCLVVRGCSDGSLGISWRKPFWTTILFRASIIDTS